MAAANEIYDVFVMGAAAHSVPVNCIDSSLVASSQALRGGRTEGWEDIFLDTDPERGIAVGERWGGALNQAINRCEAVLFLVSQPWLDSRWCLKEFNLAHRSNKRLFGVLIEYVPVVDLPAKPGHPISLF